MALNQQKLLQCRHCKQFEVYFFQIDYRGREIQTFSILTFLQFTVAVAGSTTQSFNSIPIQQEVLIQLK